MSAEARATLIILDGARPDVFEHLMRAGDLPHISRHIVEVGGMVPAVSTFPSTTGVAYLPFLTGCFAGTCDIPGIRWLDPRRYAGRWWRDRHHVRSYCGYQGRLLNSDLAPSRVTLFDIEPAAVALCTPFVRGLADGRLRVSRRRAVLGSVAHYTGTYRLLDREVGRDLAAVARERRRLVFAVFPGIDGLSHCFDPWHPAVLELYRDFDAAIGRYAARGGFDGDHLVVVASDHGMARIERHTDVALALERRGLPTLRHPVLWRRQPRVAVMVSGNASAQIYLEPGTRRAHRWSVSALEAGEVPRIPADLIRYLAALEGVALVAGCDGEDVVMSSVAGRARLQPGDGGRIRYVPETADVLCLGNAPVTRHQRGWLHHSVEGAYPDAPLQLLQLFRSPRAGDLVVMATPRADLRSRWELPEHRSGHGSLVKDHMRCLVALTHPVTGPLRTVDLFPLILRHLGHAVPAGLDGVAPESAAHWT